MKQYGPMCLERKEREVSNPTFKKSLNDNFMTKQKISLPGHLHANRWTQTF